jgi:hypothetical protein
MKKIVEVIDDCRDCEYLKYSDECFVKNGFYICTHKDVKNPTGTKVDTKYSFVPFISIPDNCPWKIILNSQ